MKSLQWDIFCKVIDNFGDLGVCWRLAADLGARGERVRLWVDDASALAWMAPGVQHGVKTNIEVLPWTESVDVSCLDAAPCDVLIEAFGCEIAPQFIAACSSVYLARGNYGQPKPLWINLEYLSAEPCVERNHGLTNLVNSGPLAGWRKVFYYPGFTLGTGGLLREADLLERQVAFPRSAWLKLHGIDRQGETVVSLFCYEPPALAGLLNALAQNGIQGQPVRLLVAAGRATDAVKAIALSKIAQNMGQIGPWPNETHGKLLSISYLPHLSQIEFDHLLWASDINFVRGEDSLVRAIWAGKPFVWQIYPQDDGAHHAKLEAFLDMLDAPHDVRTFHRKWNGLAYDSLPPPLQLPELPAWQQATSHALARLSQQQSLTASLLEYARKTR